MLEPIMKGLIEWIYGLIEDMADYVFGDIIDVMTMDMDYFRKAAPIVNDISEVIFALGWALLLGNLVFQLLKSIMSGAGFEGEDPKLLFMRTFAFSFLLLASPQICEMCSKMTGIVVLYLNIPRSFAFSPPSSLMFSAAGGVSWLIAIIVSIILIIQLIKLFFDIGERYVIACVLTFMAPLAFAMGGSRNTNDIFKGWCRMYGSMNLMLIMNIIFLKLIMNAMVNMWASNIIVWLVFVMALTRVARKIDAHIAKIGLNPAQTSNSVGVRFPGGMTLVVVRTLASLVGKNMGGMKGGSGGGNRSGGSSNHNHNHGGGSPSGGGSRPRNTNPPPSNNGGNTSPGDAHVDVSVNNQSRTTKVGSPAGNTVNRQANNAANNSKYSNSNSSRNDSRNSSRSETSNRETSSGNTTSAPTRNGKTTGNSSNVTTNRAQVQNTSRNAASMPSVKQNTSHTADRSNSATHDGGKDTHSSNQQRTQNPSRPPLPRKTAGEKVNIPISTVSSHPHTSQAIVNNNGNGQSGVNVNAPAVKTGSKGVTVPVVPQMQSMSRISGTVRSSDNGSVNNNTVGISSVNSDSDVHTSDMSSDNGRTDKRSTVIVGENRTASNVSGDNSHCVTNTTVNTTKRRVNPEYKFGRYDPAAANHKGRIYTKNTETLLRKNENKRGENSNVRTKKRNTESSSRSTGRRRNR